MPFLVPGDTVRFVSPASQPQSEGIARRAAVLRSWGLKVEIAPHAFDKLSFLAGTDADRLADLADAFLDPQVRAVFATRGGKGSHRIAHRLPFPSITHDPKPLVGFSDITLLHLMLWKRCRLAGVHGALTSDPEGNLSATAAASLRAVLMEDGPVRMAADPVIESSALTRSGTATGRLLGGNLDMLATAAGWALPSLDGAILLLESVGLGIGQIDRALTMLVRARHLERVAGVAVGYVVGTPPHPPWNAIDVMGQHLAGLGVPVLGGLPIGHHPDAQSLPVGLPTLLDATNELLTVQARR